MQQVCAVFGSFPEGEDQRGLKAVLTQRHHISRHDNAIAAVEIDLHGIAAPGIVFDLVSIAGKCLPGTGAEIKALRKLQTVIVLVLCTLERCRELEMECLLWLRWSPQT